MSAYKRDFDETKFMSFFIKDDELSEKYNEIWEKVKNNIKKEFDIYKLKQNLIMGKSKKKIFFTIVKYQNKILNLLVYQKF